MVKTSVRMLLRALSPATIALQTLRRPVWRLATLMMVSVTAASLLSADDLPEECKKYENVRIPRGDQPTAAKIKALVDCDANDLYYGFSNPPDPVKARLCAFAEIARDEHLLPFDGPTMLMMIYANGKGVARNLDLAILFACKASGYTARRLQHLEELKAENWRGSDFDYCDDVGLGQEWDLCLANQDRFAEAKRKNQMDAIMSKWSAADKQAFAKVQLEEHKYREAMSGEVDYNVHSWHADLLGKGVTMEDLSLSVLSRLESGKFPDSRNTGFAKADAELNEVYKETIRQLKKYEGTAPRQHTTIGADSVRSTERIWLNYLTAWIAFVQYKYPLAPVDCVRTWLTEARAEHLKGLTIY